MNIPYNDLKESVFIRKTANEWIAKAQGDPIPKMLFSEFWYEKELCILFADTNLGKTILAVQLAESIASGMPIHDFKMEAKKSKILYFDLELSPKQFEYRYSKDYLNHYVFSDNFERIEMNSEVIPDGDISEKINQSIEKEIKDSKAKVIFVDNITWLRSNNETAKDALPLMKHLRSLQRKYKLSILALAHTPKRDLTKAITRNDLAGSKMLMNFCDSSFAIGESHQDVNLRYIKQIKERATRKLYGFDNVIVCEVTKEKNFLQFEKRNNDHENSHLKSLTKDVVDQRKESIFELADKGISAREIAKQIGVSNVTVSKHLKNRGLDK